MTAVPTFSRWARALAPTAKNNSRALYWGCGFVALAIVICLLLSLLPGGDWADYGILILLPLFYLSLVLLGYLGSRPAGASGYKEAAADGLLAGLIPVFPVMLSWLVLVFCFFLLSLGGHGPHPGEDLLGVGIIAALALPIPVCGGAGGLLRNVYFNFSSHFEFKLEPLLQAAEQGDIKAMLALGSKLYTGSDIPQDRARAAVWFAKAAELGSAPAQATIGEMYYKGDGLPQDPGKAFEWWSKAAEQGYAQAQCALGMLYFKGEGLPADPQKAFDLWTKAAVQGYEPAKKNLEVLAAIKAKAGKN